MSRKEFIETVNIGLKASAEIYLDYYSGFYIILVHDKELRSLEFSSSSLEGARTIAYKHVYRIHNKGGEFTPGEVAGYCGKKFNIYFS